MGDGGALMMGNEIATACQYGGNPIVIISDNSMYGTIRAHQEKTYPGRVEATALVISTPLAGAPAGTLPARHSAAARILAWPDRA